ncbi:MAG: hypothetical protein OEO18_18540 [Gammaproteobacteria bacterium]|nr:hypothetical protein [Gammaproteobacteria bacterium]
MADTKIIPLIDTSDGSRQEIYRLPIETDYLEELLRYVFTNHWRSIVFGPIIEGAAYEFRCPERPRSITMFDGYLTVHFGGTHFHLCIGDNDGSDSRPTPGALKKTRRTSRAEIVRGFDADGAPIMWQLRLFNGDDTPQLNIFFPNPFLTDEDGIAERPDWSRLAVWDDIATRYLGRMQSQDPRDRSGKGFNKKGC